MRRALAIGLAVWLGSGVVVVAQSLGDVARKEAERRKQVKTPSRVLTNKDLGVVPPPSPQPPPPAQPAEPEAARADTPSKPGEGPVDEEEQRRRDEAAWRQKMADGRQALDRNRMYLAALQSQINGLWADFTARDDPAQRAQIERQRHTALAEFDRLKTDIAAQEKALADLEEQARRQGAPPGWLR